jgi:hypothetical protein
MDCSAPVSLLATIDTPAVREVIAVASSSGSTTPLAFIGR